jgi:S-(hydroxymethyl)glutathione dehydrogenase / alcohol dehydrogenase
MKAVVFHKMKDITVDTVPDPIIEHPQDAIIEVTSTAICGSDLHIYNGMIPQAKDMVMGHEFMGIVVETGKEVTHLKKGDRVVVPFPISCGSCFFCQHGHFPHCENTNPDNYGPDGGLLTEKGGGIFGYTDLYGGYDGGQAEFVRVPFANVGPRKVSDELSDEQVLFLTDILPTGYAAVDWAGIRGGETVAVFGCGPVGLMAMKCAWLRGAERVIGVDLEPYRLEMAHKTVGVEWVNINDDDPVEKIREMTHGRGADVCIDAVGMEAHRSFTDRISSVIHMEKGTINALEMCFGAVRRGGVVSVVGVYGSPYDNFPWHQFFDKGLTLRAGQAPVHYYIDELMDHIEQGRIVTNDIITHRLHMSEASHAYDIFNKKLDNCVKVVMQP